MKILVINGPNINMLGIREPNVYGRATFAELEKFILEAQRSAASRPSSSSRTTRALS